jgi:hypothetical protein
MEEDPVFRIEIQSLRVEVPESTIKFAAIYPSPKQR